jgi:hypothetical protein
MICPFCQADLQPSTLSCPRCGAAYPVSGGVLGLRLRTLAIAFVLLVISSLMLVDCVLRNLPGSGLAPNMKSTEAQRALLMMQRHQQATQNQPPPPLQR